MHAPGWQRMAWVVATGLFAGGLLSTSCLRDNPNHCAHAGGDAHCAELHDDAPFCSRCTSQRAGCVEERPASNCHVESDVADGESSGSGGSSTTDGPTSTDTSAEVDCTGEGRDSACPDDAPYCVDGTCVSCSSGGGSTICEQFEPDKPVCQDAVGVCVVCLPDDTQHCPESEPFCDDSFSCSGCFEHEHCPESACDIERGTCFDASRVFWVDNAHENCPEGGPGTEEEPFCTIGEALEEIKSPSAADFELESEGVIKIFRNGGAYTENLALTNGQDKRIALIGLGQPMPQLRNATYAIEVGRHRLYVSRLLISHNTEGGIRSTLQGRVWLDDLTISANPVGVRVAAGSRVRMRRARVVSNLEQGVVVALEDARAYATNSVIGNNGDERAVEGIGVLVDEGGGFEANYTTIAHNKGMGPAGLVCNDSVATVRNSIVIGPGLNGIDCDLGEFSYSFVDTEIEGDGIVVTDEYDAMWFGDVATGLFRPTSSNPFDGTARWDDGDPLFDLNRNPRVWVPGTPDMPGAIRP